MAFDLRNFSSIAGNSTRGRSPVIHGYHTDDDKNTVITTPNYFAPIIQDLSVGDFIFVDSSVSSQFVLNVTSKGLNGIIEVEDSTIGSSGGLLVDESNPTLSADLNVNGNAFDDANGNELLTFNSLADAVNNLRVWNTPSGTGVVIEAEGDDINIDVALRSKGAGDIKLESDKIQLSGNALAELEIFASSGDAVLKINRIDNTKYAKTVYETASSTTWLSGLDSTPALFADDYTIKRTDGSNPDFVVLNSNGFIGIGNVATAPTANLHVRASSGTVRTLTESLTTADAINIVRGGGDAFSEIERGIGTASAALFYKRAGIEEWIVGIFSAPASTVQDFSIRRGSIFNPAFLINRTSSFVKIGETNTSPLTSLHVERAFGTCEILSQAISGSSAVTVKSNTSSANLNLDRSNPSSDCSINLKTFGAVQWTIGSESTPSSLRDDLTIRRGIGFTPDIQVDKTNGWVKFGGNISSPTTPVHVQQLITDAILYVEGLGSAEAVVRAGSQSGNALVDIRRGGVNRDALVTYRDNSTVRWVHGMDSSPVGNRNDWVLKTGLDATPQFVFTTSGELGIGAPVPSARLHVANTSNTDALISSSAGNCLLTLDANNDSRFNLDRGSASDECVIRYYTNGTINFIVGIENTAGNNDNYAFKRSEGATPDGYISAVDGGLVWGTPTGGSQGLGTINAVGVYDDSVLLTCYVLEQLVDGDVDLAKWDAIGTVNESGESKHIPANRFKETLTPYMDIEEYTNFFKTNKHLPSFPSFEEYSKMSTGDLAQRLWETVEFQAVHNAQLLDRVKEMETKMQNLENKLSNLGV